MDISLYFHIILFYKMKNNNEFSFRTIEEARERIKPYIPETPLAESMYLSTGGSKYYFKLECEQAVRSFKIRGALNKMLTLNEEEKERGVTAISSGNHGISVSYAAKLLGIKTAVIIVPETTPKIKCDKIKYYGGDIHLLGKNYDEAHILGMEYSKSHKLTFIDGYYNDPLVYGGQGTVGMEILKQNPNIDTILAPIGGGGLLTGVAVAAKHINPKIRVIGIQTSACPAMIKSYEDNVFYESYPNEESICESLIGGIGKLSFEMAKDYVDKFVMVEEESIKKAIAFMIGKEMRIVEPGGAVCVAAIMDFAKDIGGKEIALIISGGNINKYLMIDIINNY